MRLFHAILILFTITSCSSFLYPKSNDSIRKKITGQDFTDNEVNLIIIKNRESNNIDTLSKEEQLYFLKKIDKVKCKGIFKCIIESTITINLQDREPLTIYTSGVLIGKPSTYYGLPFGKKIIPKEKN